MKDLTQQVVEAWGSDTNVTEFYLFLEICYLMPLAEAGVEITKYSHIEGELGNCHVLEGPVKDSSFNWLDALDRILHEAWDNMDDKPYWKIESGTLMIMIPYSE